LLGRKEENYDEAGILQTRFETDTSKIKENTGTAL
jgi:hypothetical protein